MASVIEGIAGAEKPSPPGEAMTEANLQGQAAFAEAAGSGHQPPQKIAIGVEKVGDFRNFVVTADNGNFLGPEIKAVFRSFGDHPQKKRGLRVKQAFDLVT